MHEQMVSGLGSWVVLIMQLSNSVSDLMSKIIVSLVVTGLGVMEYLNRGSLLILTGYATLIITLRSIPIFVSLRRLFPTVLKWWMIVILFLFTG